MLGSDDLAQDAVQEAAMQAWLSLDRLKRPEQFGPWLSGIALNISRHWLRNHGQGDCSWDVLVGGRFDPRYVLADEHLGPDERAEASELRARVQAAVAALPRGQRAAIVLYYLYGLTQAETAAHLGIELGAVKTRLHKARGTLRKQLLALWEDQMTTPVPSPMVVMRIASVRKLAENLGLPPHVPSSHPHLQRIIFLEEIDGLRYLLIHVGEHEGYQLTATLDQTEMPRPMTYSFLANVLQAAQVTKCLPWPSMRRKPLAMTMSLPSICSSGWCVRAKASPQGF